MICVVLTDCLEEKPEYFQLIENTPDQCNILILI